MYRDAIKINEVICISVDEAFQTTLAFLIQI